MIDEESLEAMDGYGGELLKCRLPTTTNPSPIDTIWTIIQFNMNCGKHYNHRPIYLYKWLMMDEESVDPIDGYGGELLYAAYRLQQTHHQKI